MARVFGLIVLVCVLAWAAPVRVARAVTYAQALVSCESKTAGLGNVIITQRCVPVQSNPCTGPGSSGTSPPFPKVVTIGKAPPNYPNCYVWNATDFAAVNCAATAGQTAVIRIGRYYESPGPFYSTLPGTPCQCTFFMTAAWQGDPGLTIGKCTGTGRFYGDDGDDPDPPVLVDAPSGPANPCDGGGLSCITPQGDICYGSGGKQICVPGPGGAGSGNPGETPPHCVQGDGVALCAGTPDAPEPQPKPQGDPIGDEDISTSDGAGAPPSNTQIITWDTTNQGNNANPGDGAGSTGSTGNGGNNGSEGKPDPETGRCADGSIPTASGCNAGYTDNGCDVPPTCSGDVLQCAALREQHATRCAQAKRAADFADVAKARASITAAGIEAEPALPSTSSIFRDVSLGGEGEGTGLDESGYGLATTCPIEPKEFELMGQSVTIDYSRACDFLGLARPLLMILAYLLAARILVLGDSK